MPNPKQLTKTQVDHLLSKTFHPDWVPYLRLLLKLEVGYDGGEVLLLPPSSTRRPYKGIAQLGYFKEVQGKILVKGYMLDLMTNPYLTARWYKVVGWYIDTPERAQIVAHDPLLSLVAAVILQQHYYQRTVAKLSVEDQATVNATPESINAFRYLIHQQGPTGALRSMNTKKLYTKGQSKASRALFKQYLGIL